MANRTWFGSLLFFILFVYSSAASAQSVRIKDLVNFRGMRTNQLTGFGLVIGLAGTGDSAANLTRNKAVANLLTRIGMQTKPEDVATASIAAVIVTADLDTFRRNGDRIDVKVSVIGDASSLAGGTLLKTPLHASDGNLYVVSQGSIVVGQASGSGPQVLTTALVPNGGIVEREFRPVIAPEGKLTLSLRNSDATTSARVAEKVNQYFRGFYAFSIDPVTVEVVIPPLFKDRKMEFISEMEGLKVDADQKAIVVLNERTGTVVMGADVVISKIAISHGDLSIRVGAPESGAPKPNQVLVNMGGTTVGSLVETINALGIKPADLVGIIQTIHASGALRADLKFM